MIALVFGLQFLPHDVGAQAAQPLSPAQAALFASNHLKSIHGRAELDYRFQHDADGVESYSDKVALTVTDARAEERKDVAVAFLTGSRHIEFPPVADFAGNPLLMYFLEYDVKGMSKATGGAALYFRNRIRDALFDGAELHPVSIALDGRTIEGTEIIIHPYAKISRPEIAPFVGKSYRFTLSDAVPGMLYQISTEVPKSDKAGRVTESVTFAGEQP
jgi:hypothetical protein